MACNNAFFPEPLGPAINIERIKGQELWICSEPSGKIQYSVRICLISPGEGFVPDLAVIALSPKY